MAIDLLLAELADLKRRLENKSDLTPSQFSTIRTQIDKIKAVLSAPPQAPMHQSTSSDALIHIWSDGACSGNPGPGGWGTLVLMNGEMRELSGGLKRTTNNIMEMTGALEGIRITPEGAKIVLTSDSQYLVKGMTEWIHGWKKRKWKKADGNPVLNQELWVELDREASKRNITWKWVKGHAGHPENERCDELARNAI